MKRNIFYLLFAGVVFASCNQKKALDYNNKLVNIERSLEPDVRQTESSVATYIASKQYDSIVAVSSRMENKLDETIKQISAISVPSIPEADNFKNGYINFYKFLKTFYTDYKNYGQAKTDEERQSILTDLQTNALTKKNSEIMTFQSIQRKFAEANHMKLQATN